MIEVEKKFTLTKETEMRIAESAKFVGEETITDVYYDDPDYSIVSRDMWFRNRDGKFELKVFIGDFDNRVIDQYEEIEDEARIRTILGLSDEGQFPQALKEKGIMPFLTCVTVRKTYTWGDFTIVIDTVDLNHELTYRLGEIELMVENKNKMSGATERILAFAETLGVSPVAPDGKIVHYLKEKRPAHYEAFKNRKSFALTQ